MKTRGIASALLSVLLVAGLFPATALAGERSLGAGAMAQAAVEVAPMASTYKVAFSANGGKGSMGSQTVRRGEITALNANKFARSGYKFAGWNTKANGKGKTYKNKAKVRNLAAAGKTVKLYAQWKKAGKGKTKGKIVRTKSFTLTLPAYWNGRVKTKVSSRRVHQSWGDFYYTTQNVEVLDKNGHTILYITGGTKEDNRKLASVYDARTSNGAWRASADNTGIGYKAGAKCIVEVTCPDTWMIPSVWSGYGSAFMTVSEANNAADLLTGGKVKSKSQLSSRGGMLETHIKRYLKKNIVNKMEVR